MIATYTIEVKPRAVIVHDGRVVRSRIRFVHQDGLHIYLLRADGEEVPFDLISYHALELCRRHGMSVRLLRDVVAEDVRRRGPRKTEMQEAMEKYSKRLPGFE